MSNEIEIFNNPSFGNIRVQKDEDGEPLFCLADVCRALEIDNASQVKQQVCEEFGCPILKIAHLADSLGRIQEANFITEQQMYFVMSSSRKPNAKPFRMWVNTVVLPSIRKHGSYSIKTPVDTIVYSSDPLERCKALTLVLEEERAKQALIEARADKAEDNFNTLVHNDNNTYTATDLAKDLGFRSAIAFNQWLKDIGFQYKQGKHWVVKAEYAEMGLINIKLKDTGNGFNVKTMQFTNKGKLWITEKYKQTHPKVLEIEYM